MQDLRYACRLLRKSPAYSLAAISALAVGMAANIAVFSVVNGVLLKSYPYKDPQTLVFVYEKVLRTNKVGVSPTDFDTLRRIAHSYSALSAFQTVNYELSGVGAPQRISGARVVPDLLPLLGASPALGRSLTADDDRRRLQVALISDGLWSRGFGRDPAAIGRNISLDGRTYTIVGVMPRRFVFPPRGAEINGLPADLFVPMSFRPNEMFYGSSFDNTVVGRLKDGVSIAQARAEAETLTEPLAQSYPAALQAFVRDGASISISSLSEETVGGSRRLVLLLMAAVAVILLIGCADVAGLILTRSAGRERELSIRAALGAGRMRIVRQLLTEAAVLAAAGSTLGLCAAYAGTRGLVALAGNKLPRTESITFDSTMVVFTLALAALTPLLFGVLPAIRAARAVHADVLKDRQRGLMPGRGRGWLLGSLVVAQFALALVVSVGAGLLVRSFNRLLSTDTGFTTERTIHASMVLPFGRYAPATVKAFNRRALAAVHAVPGATIVGAGDLPLTVPERSPFSADATGRQLPQSERLVARAVVRGSYFDALGIRLKLGRLLTDADNETASRVAVVNEAFAKLAWSGADAIGRQIRWGIGVPQNNSRWMTIVGIVPDVKQAGLGRVPLPQVYVPSEQDEGRTGRQISIVVRSTRDAAAVAAEVRAVFQQLDPSLPVAVETLDEVVRDSVQPQRFTMTVMTAFAGIALLLAALGIYGVLTNAVSQQTQEIGIRVALGATSFDILRVVLSRALLLMSAGLALGAAAAFAVTRTMASLLFEIKPTDVTSFGGAIVSLAAVALLASLLPAWRATRVDPIVALRSE
jgi:putative ABC transport system permease protein